MENVDFGILCLIPPIITIILALVTKNTILSLFSRSLGRSYNHSRLESALRIYQCFQ